MRVLVADDEVSARLIAKKKIESFGYEVIAVEDGKQAIASLEGENPPRLAVLDWMMPGLDGVDICARLNDRKTGPLIYTILLTSKSDQEDMVEALEKGAHDFQTKPLDPNELRCRLQVGARLVEAEDRVARYAANMEKLAEERARQLVHADRLAALGTLMAGIIHEINNPVGFISGNAQTQQMMWKHIEPCIAHCRDNGIGEIDKLAFCQSEMPESISSIRNGVARLNGMIDGMKRYSRESTDAAELFSINDCVENALLLCNNALKYDICVHKNLDGDIPRIKGFSQRIEQVFVNLFVNAADAMSAQNGGALHITTRCEGDSIKISVRDTGPGIPEDVISRVFDPFYTTKPAGKGTGLGLSISKGILEAHGGTLLLKSEPGQGADFQISLPLVNAKDQA